MVRRAYAGGSVPTTLASPISNVDSSATLDAVSGYPSGSSKWFAVIDKGTATEEKVLVTNVSGFVVTITRGQDGTTAQAHSAGATFEHCFTATDADEANAHVNATGAEHGLPVGASFVGTTGAQTLTDKTISGADNTLTNIPASASPEIVALITAVADDLALEETARATDDGNRYTKTESDNRYLNVGGDTATGPLILHTTSPSSTNEAAAKGYVDKQVPIGSVTMFAGSAIPTGWLACDGSAVSRTTYATLFAAIGTAYGVGDGSTTFGLPNLAGRVPVGYDPGQTEFDALGESGGEKTHTLTGAESGVAAHTHGVTDPGHFHTTQTYLSDTGAGDSAPKRDSVDSGDISFAGAGNTNSKTTGVTVDAATETSAASAHNNLQPYLTLNFIIRAL